jgi:hypothetical protein
MRSSSGETLRTSDSRIAMWEEETPIATYSVQLKTSGQFLNSGPPTTQGYIKRSSLCYVTAWQQQDV